MTVSNTTTKVTYLGDGLVRRFDVPFACLDKADIALFITGPEGELKRVESGFAVSADKTYVTYPQDQNAPALKTGFKITLMRQTPITQENDLIQQNILQKETLETSLDKLTMLAQELAERLGRAVTVGPDENTESVSAAELVQQMRELYAQIKTLAQTAGEEAQKAIDAAVEAYEQAEKLYSNMEYYVAGTPSLDYTGDLQTFQLCNSYKADGYSLKVFVNGLLKRLGTNYDYTEVANPELENKGDDYGDTVHFNSPLTAGDTVCFVWGDTLTMPGGQVAQAAALAAETAQAQAQAAAAAAAEAKENASVFIPKPVGEIYYSQSALAKDNPAAVPAWTGQTLSKISLTWPSLLEFVKAHPERQISAADYAALLETKKQCPFYVLDETADTLKLPVYSRFIASVRDDGQIGAFSDQMRPITGRFRSGSMYHGNYGGSFVTSDAGGKGGGQDGSGWDSKNVEVSFDSSRLGDHYNSPETLPAHVREYPWIVAATCVPDIIKHPAGIYSTQDLNDALADRPTKTQTDGLYAPKATTYTKTEVDGKIAAVVLPQTPASTTQLGLVKVDGTTITAAADGTLSAVTEEVDTSDFLSKTKKDIVNGDKVFNDGKLFARLYNVYDNAKSNPQPAIDFTNEGRTTVGQTEKELYLRSKKRISVEKFYESQNHSAYVLDTDNFEEDAKKADTTHYGIVKLGVAGGAAALDENGTLPAAQLPDIDCVVETAVSENGSWSRVYKSGWVEQGGYIASTASAVSVTLSKAFANTNYCVQLSAAAATAPTAGSAVSTANKTCQAFDIVTSETDGAGIYWEAKGQGAAE